MHSKKRKELLTRSIRVDLRKRLVKTRVWPVVLYGCETWTMRKEEINCLNAFEMWVWRKMCLREAGLMKLVLEGRMEGKKPRGRPRMGMIDDVLDETYGDMKRKAKNREKWRMWKPRTCLWAEN